MSSAVDQLFDFVDFEGLPKQGADKGVWDMLLEILVSTEAKSNYTLSHLANPQGDQSRKRKRLKLLKL